MSDENKTETTTPAPAPAAPQIDISAIAGEVAKKLDIDSVAARIRDDVVGGIADKLTPPKKNDDDPRQALSQFANHIKQEAVETAKAEIAATQRENQAMLAELQKAQNEYPDLANLTGEVSSDWQREMSAEDGLTPAEALKKALPKTIKRLEEKGLIKKYSPEEAAVRNGMVPPGRGAGSGAGGGETKTDPVKSMTDFWAARVKAHSAIRRRAT